MDVVVIFRCCVCDLSVLMAWNFCKAYISALSPFMYVCEKSLWKFIYLLICVRRSSCDFSSVLFFCITLFHHSKRYVNDSAAYIHPIDAKHLSLKPASEELKIKFCHDVPERTEYFRDLLCPRSHRIHRLQGRGLQQ